MKLIEAVVTGILAGGGCFLLVRYRPFMGMASPPIVGGISPDLDTIRRAVGKEPSWRHWAARLAALVGFGLGVGLTITNP
jgi:hypothetical protein